MTRRDMQFHVVLELVLELLPSVSNHSSSFYLRIMVLAVTAASAHQLVPPSGQITKGPMQKSTVSLGTTPGLRFSLIPSGFNHTR